VAYDMPASDGACYGLESVNVLVGAIRNTRVIPKVRSPMFKNIK
jgi:hypothetical protein